MSFILSKIVTLIIKNFPSPTMPYSITYEKLSGPCDKTINFSHQE